MATVVLGYFVVSVGQGPLACLKQPLENYSAKVGSGFVCVGSSIWVLQPFLVGLKMKIRFITLFLYPGMCL